MVTIHFRAMKRLISLIMLINDLKWPFSIATVTENLTTSTISGNKSMN